MNEGEIFFSSSVGLSSPLSFSITSFLYSPTLIHHSMLSFFPSAEYCLSICRLCDVLWRLLTAWHVAVLGRFRQNLQNLG